MFHKIYISESKNNFVDAFEFINDLHRSSPIRNRLNFLISSAQFKSLKIIFKGFLLYG